MQNKNEIVELEIWREDISQDLSSAIQTKDDLLKSIRFTKKQYLKESASGQGKHAAAFYIALDNLLEQLESKVESTNFPEPLPEPYKDTEYAECWLFAYEIAPQGITLSLSLNNWTYNNGNPSSTINQECFILIEVPARQLTVLEYAQQYGLDFATVQEKLNQDRIRGAVKTGDTWYLPELAEVSSESDSLNIPVYIAHF